jgi:hypothetical protein
VDRAELSAKLDRLLTLRGDPAKGLPATAWAEHLDGVAQDDLLRAAIEAVRSLVIQDWADKRKTDKRPQAALESAEAYLAKDPEALTAAKKAAKDCTAAKNETFGTDHRVAEAARAVAWAAGDKDATHIFEAFALVEHELLSRIALLSEYHRGPEMRRSVVDAIRRVLVPPEQAPAPDPVSKGDAPPVPYNADGHFELGQRLTHKKFGEVVVTSVGETWIEVELPDATKKRLAHKP